MTPRPPLPPDYAQYRRKSIKRNVQNTRLCKYNENGIAVSTDHFTPLYDPSGKYHGACASETRVAACFKNVQTLRTGNKCDTVYCNNKLFASSLHAYTLTTLFQLTLKLRSSSLSFAINDYLDLIIADRHARGNHVREENRKKENDCMPQQIASLKRSLACLMLIGSDAALGM